MFFFKSRQLISNSRLEAYRIYPSSSINLTLKTDLGLSGLKLLGSSTSLDSFISFDNSITNTGLQVLRSNLQKGGYFIELFLKGIGFKVFRFGDYLFLQLGYSHFYVYKIPFQVVLKAKRDRIVIFGWNRALVGNTAYDIYSLRKPDAYKAKGVQYKSRFYKLKEGKKK